MNNVWIRKNKKFEDSMTFTSKIFCLPYAGGGASIYYNWQQYFCKFKIKVCPVVLPGREDRMFEPLVDNAKTLARQIYEGIKSELNTPFYIFGHSMGGVLAYELTKVIYQEEKKLPKILFMSATSLELRNKDFTVYTMSDEELINHISKNGATDAELLNQPLFRDFYINIIRNDYKLSETYISDNYKIPSKVCVFLSKEDDIVSNEKSFKLKNIADNIEFSWFKGGHFFINSCQQNVCNRIISAIASA
ncbi:MAG: thioesterase domain-containing protein [Ruminococcus sp.]|nr:thioesterase domain-containing protein [Ruminococcus sp.]